VDQLRQAGRLVEAENLCRTLFAAQPNSPIVLNILGLLRRARGDQAEAELLMRKAIAAAPREPALHNNLGNILLSRGDAPGAEAAYRKAIALKPDFPEACFNLGIALREQHRGDEALAAQRRAVSLRPNYAQALVQQGVLMSEKGQAQDALVPLEAAIPSLQAAVDIAPHRHEARYVVAKAFAHVGREEDALVAYQTVFERKPDFLPALQDFTSLAWSMGNGAKSLSGFEYARSKTGETPDLLLAEANLRLRFSDEISISAEAMLRRARDMAPARADIANALARALVLQGRLEQSFPVFQDAIKAEPGVVRHHQDFGEALLSHGEFTEARSVFQDALALDPHDQITLAGLTLAYRELGDSRYGELVDVDRFVRVFEIAPPPGFGDLAGFNRMLASELERLHTRQAPPLDQTLRNGTQTAGTLFRQNNRAIEAVREQIAAAV